jgi:hypothetical protein
MRDRLQDERHSTGSEGRGEMPSAMRLRTQPPSDDIEIQEYSYTPFIILVVYSNLKGSPYESAPYPQIDKSRHRAETGQNSTIKDKINFSHPENSPPAGQNS